jgi:hypothetical protein
MKIYFLPYGILFSPLWNFIFSLMKIYFLPYEILRAHLRKFSCGLFLRKALCFPQGYPAEAGVCGQWKQGLLPGCR